MWNLSWRLSARSFHQTSVHQLAIRRKRARARLSGQQPALARSSSRAKNPPFMFPLVLASSPNICSKHQKAFPAEHVAPHMHNSIYAVPEARVLVIVIMPCRRFSDSVCQLELIVPVCRGAPHLLHLETSPRGLWFRNGYATTFDYLGLNISICSGTTFFVRSPVRPTARRRPSDRPTPTIRTSGGSQWARRKHI